MMRRRKRWFKRRRGAATVEFALTVPLVFLFFFASIEFGRVYMIRQTLQNAAYEAARLGLVPETSNKTIRKAAKSMMGAVSVKKPRVAVAQDDETVTVTVSVNVNDHSWIAPVFFKDKRLTSSLTLNKDDA